MITLDFNKTIEDYTYDVNNYKYNKNLVIKNIEKSLIIENQEIEKCIHYDIDGFFTKKKFSELLSNIKCIDDEDYIKLSKYIRKYIYPTTIENNIYFYILLKNDNKGRLLKKFTAEQLKLYINKSLVVIHNNSKTKINIVDLVANVYDKLDYLIQVIDIPDYPFYSIINNNLIVVNSSYTTLNVSNLKINNIKEFKDYDYNIKEKIFIFFDHIKGVLCSGNIEIYEFYKQFILGTILGIKMEYGIINSGGQGTGKSIMINALKNVFLNNGAVSNVPNKDALLKYNKKFIKNKNLAVIEEGTSATTSKTNNYSFEEKLKELITGHNLDVDAKFQEYETVRNNCNFIINTNSQTPVAIQNDERRLLYPDIALTLKNKNDEIVKKRIEDLLFQTPEIFTDYEYKTLLSSCMYSYALENFNHSYICKQPPDSLHKQAIKSTTKTDIIRFLEYLVKNNISLTNLRNRISINDVLTHYFNFQKAVYKLDINTDDPDDPHFQELKEKKTNYLFENLNKIVSTVGGTIDTKKKRIYISLQKIKEYLKTYEKQEDLAIINNNNEEDEETIINKKDFDFYKNKYNSIEKEYKENSIIYKNKLSTLENDNIELLKQLEILKQEVNNLKTINNSLLNENLKLQKNNESKKAIKQHAIDNKNNIDDLLDAEY